MLYVECVGGCIRTVAMPVYASEEEKHAYGVLKSLLYTECVGGRIELLLLYL